MAEDFGGSGVSSPSLGDVPFINSSSRRDSTDTSTIPIIGSSSRRDSVDSPAQTVLASNLSLLGGSGRPFDLAAIQALLDPAPGWMWTADIVDCPKLPNLANIYVRNIDMPLSTFDVEPRFRAGGYIYYPKFSAIGQLHLTFYEPGDYVITKYLAKWFVLIKDNKGNYGLPADYMGSVILRLYDTTAKLQCTLSARAVWPMQRSSMGLNYDHSIENVISCAFSVNIVEIDNINKFESGGGTNSASTSTLNNNSSTPNTIPNPPSGGSYDSGSPVNAVPLPDSTGATPDAANAGGNSTPIITSTRSNTERNANDAITPDPTTVQSLADRQLIHT